MTIILLIVTATWLLLQTFTCYPVQHEIELPLQMRVHRVKILCLKKRGLIVSKNEIFEKFFSKIEKGFKSWIINMRYLAPNKIFKKSQNFEFFQKRGVKGVKKWFFWKNISKIKKGFKNWVLNMSHMPPKRIFKKSQNFEFFQKRGVRGSKNDFFEKIFPKSKRASKIGY